MKNLFLYLSAAILLLLAGCTPESFEEEHKTGGKDNFITFIAIMPDDSSRTRISLDREDESLDVNPKWEVNDVLHLYAKSGDNIEVQAVTLKASDISNEGKTAAFSVKLPEGEENFSLYGVYGGEIVEGEETKVELPANYASGELSDLPIVLKLEMVDKSRISSDLEVGVEHVGSLFCIQLKNASEARWDNIQQVQLFAESEIGAHIGSNNGAVLFDFVTGEFTNSEPGNALTFALSEAVDIDPDAIQEFWGWFAPNTEKWPEMKLKVIDGSGNELMVSSNSKPERESATPVGKAFYFPALYNGNSLNFNKNISVIADLLDVQFKADGTAIDLSPMNHTVQGISHTYPYAISFNNIYNRYIATFNPIAVGTNYTANKGSFFRINYDDNFIQRLADGHTLECLVKFDVDYSEGGGKTAKILSTQENGGTGLQVSAGEGGLAFIPFVGSDYVRTYSYIYPDDKSWYHLVGVWDKEKGKSIIYVNGEKKNEIDANGVYTPTHADARWIAIGGDPGKKDILQAASMGSVAVARMYDRALEDADVEKLWSEFKHGEGIQDGPEKEEVHLEGTVSCNGIGVKNVAVSDGFNVVKTDENGYYSMMSEKKTGFVFISVPGNYESIKAPNSNIPQFFKRFTDNGSQNEQIDFELVNAPNEEHILLTMADMHLANRTNDLNQFRSGFLEDVNDLIQSYKTTGKKVYGLTLGDQSWSSYWVSNSFFIADAMKEVQKIDCPIFHVIGNHDHDPYVGNNDYLASLAYREVSGPTYYSFNLGNVHYVILDNMFYINDGGSSGVKGKENYTATVVKDQIEWLKKDLATVTDKSKPLVIAMHVPMHGHPALDSNGAQVDSYRLTNASELMSCINGFSDAKIITGHTHVNFNVTVSPSVKEMNIGAVCATWWWTGEPRHAGNHVCKDGSPGGYGVWENNAKRTSYYYKGIGHDRNYQFRTYDLNTVLIDERFIPAYPQKATALASYAGVYGISNTNNEVLINVWNYNRNWKVEVAENGLPLNVTRIEGLDPLHIVSYEAQRLNNNATPTSSFVSVNTTHLFKVKASSTSSTLVIKVTDDGGNVYTEEMERPKIFTLDMR